MPASADASSKMTISAAFIFPKLANQQHKQKGRENLESHLQDHFYPTHNLVREYTDNNTCKKIFEGLELPWHG